MPPSAESPVAAEAPPRRALVEALAVYALATAAAAVLYRLRSLDAWFHVIVAALFLYLPAWVLRHRDLDEFGLDTRSPAAQLGLLAVVVLVVFPPFLVGFLAWQKLACAVPSLRALAGAPCAATGGGLFSGFHLRWPAGLFTLDPRRNLLLAEVLVVALPEEFFFRGYLMTRLGEALPPTRRLLGAPVGLALVVSSALFALSHVVVQGNPATASVFFPGLLFGWMRARAGSILPGTFFHALCNVYIDVLGKSAIG